MKSTDGIPRGAKVKRSDHPDFVPYRSTETMSYSLRPEQIEFVREGGGSKFIRLILDAAMGLETKDNRKSQDGQKSQKLIDAVMR